MTLSAGSRLGTYEILALLGAGGMGEVYRARDTKLAREVAIKVIPDATADDADRVARFEREAKALAALNHPHIAALYGMEQDASRHFLVMELVDGETLADRIARGPLPVGDALRLASQITEALEAAHERGIIHRDLKPANIKVTADDAVKVLDFGLAKAIDRDPAGAVNLSMSPTLSVRGTMAGVILGTAAYMSPEQAKGLPTDHRSDIFSFGCVLYELLTGRQAFPGDSVTDILASVLAREPEWQAMPSSIDPRLARLLRRCLAKSIRQRWQAIGDVRAEIDYILSEPVVAPIAVAASTVTMVRPPLWKRVVPVVAVAAIAAALAAVAVRWSTPEPAPAPVVRFAVSIPPEPAVFTNFNREVIAVSADGRQVAYSADRVYLRSIGESLAQAVPGTDGSGSVSHPTFSPDGRSIAFWATSDRTLKRVTLGSASVTTLCQLDEGGLGLQWIGDTIYFADMGRGIMRVSANGGKVETVVPINGREELYGPQLLPDGDTLLFTVGARAMPSWDQARLVAQSLKTGQRTTLVEGATSGRLVASGHLLFGRGGVLFAAPFDRQTLTVGGEPVAVIEGLRRSAPGTTGTVHYAVSPTGTLIYLPGPVSATAAVLQLALFDRSGAAESLSAPLGAYSQPRVSPDGSALAVVTDDGKEAAIWIYGFSQSSASRRLTFGGRNTSAIWSADSQRVAFQSTRESDAAIWWQRADGTDTAARLTRPDKDAVHLPRSFSPDGRHLLFDEVRADRVVLLDLSMADGRVTPFHTLASDVPTDASFSPDGKWVAYTSREPVAPSQSVVYIEPFPRTGARYQVSKSADDGHHPLWSPDGREIFYTPGPGNRFTGMPITTTPSLTFGQPFNLPRSFINAPPTITRTYDITRDGKRFLGLRTDVGPDGQPIAPQIQVVLNWFDELKTRVPIK